MIKARNIIWHLDFDKVYEAFQQLSAADAAELLGNVTEKAYEEMTDTARRTYVQLMFDKDRSPFYKFLGLPEEFDFGDSYKDQSDLDLGDRLMQFYGYSLVSFYGDREDTHCYQPRMELCNEQHGFIAVWHDWGTFDTEEEAMKVAETIQKEITDGKWKERYLDGYTLKMSVEKLKKDDNLALEEFIELPVHCTEEDKKAMQEIKQEISYSELMDILEKNGLKRRIVRFVSWDDWENKKLFVSWGDNSKIEFPLKRSEEYIKVDKLFGGVMGNLEETESLFKDAGDGSVLIYPKEHKEGLFRAYKGYEETLFLYGNKRIEPELLNGGNCDYIYNLRDVEQFIGVFQGNLVYDTGASIYMMAPDGYAIYLMESVRYKCEHTERWSEYIEGNTLIVKAEKEGEFLLQKRNLNECLRELLYERMHKWRSEELAKEKDPLVRKGFFDLQVGDVAVVYDEYCHDYVQHRIRIEEKEEDPDNWGTETNPKGIHYYGKDLDYDEEETDEYITNVHEGNFEYIQSFTDIPGFKS